MDTVPEQDQRIEAARYALLRRLAYAMRHHIVVHLQPIGMIMEVMERRLEAHATEPAQLHDSMAKVNKHARAAVQSSLDVIAWLAPEDGRLVAAEAGVQECFDLLRSHLAFRGFTLRNECGPLPREVSQPAMRSALPAALLALTDRAPSPADVVISALPAEREILISLRLEPTQGTPGFSGEPHYRWLEWSDVEAIAAAEGIGCRREERAVSLAFPA